MLHQEDDLLLNLASENVAVAKDKRKKKKLLIFMAISLNLLFFIFTQLDHLFLSRPVQSKRLSPTPSLTPRSGHSRVKIPLKLYFPLDENRSPRQKNFLQQEWRVSLYDQRNHLIIPLAFLQKMKGQDESLILEISTEDLPKIIHLSEKFPLKVFPFHFQNQGGVYQNEEREKKKEKERRSYEIIF